MTELERFELRVLELLEDWASDPSNITGLNSCDALVELYDELLDKREAKGSTG